MISSSDHVVVDPKGRKSRTSLISKESSAANPSFRVYYGVAAGAVPFLWESQPGTPKHILISSSAAGHAATIPPLTPPPSYFASPTRGGRPSAKSSAAACRKSPLSPGRLIHAILPKLRKPPARMSRSSSASSSCSSPARHGRRPSCPPSSFSSTGGSEDDDEEEDASPTSTLCFGGRHGRGGGRGCNAWVALGGHGSGS